MLLLNSAGIFAQELVSAQGESLSNASGSIDFSIGELVISTESNANNTLTQGFHQTAWEFVSLEDHLPAFSMSIFPNPTSELLTINSAVYDGVSYKMYDKSGRIVLAGELTDELTQLNVASFSDGSYSILLEQGNEPIKQFHLLKSN